MAQEQAETPTNGANASASEKAAILAELSAPVEAEEKAPPKAAPVAEASEDDDTDPEAPAAISDEDDEDDAPAAESDDTDEDEDEAVEANIDPVKAKGLAAVQRQAARLAQREQEFERKQAEWNAKIEKVSGFEEMSKRAKYDPVGALMALGLSEDDFEAASRQLYAHSKAGAADPKHKEVSARMQKEREQADKIAQLEKRFAEQEKTAAEQAQSAQARAALEHYMGKVFAAVGDTTPRAAALMKARPKSTQRELGQIASELAEQLGKAPTAAQVVAKFEKRKAAEYAAMGGFIGGDAPVKKAPANGKTRKAEAAPADPADFPATKAKTPQEEKADLLKELAELS